MHLAYQPKLFPNAVKKNIQTPKSCIAKRNTATSLKKKISYAAATKQRKLKPSSIKLSSAVLEIKSLLQIEVLTFLLNLGSIQMEVVEMRHHREDLYLPVGCEMACPGLTTRPFYNRAHTKC